MSEALFIVALLGFGVFPWAWVASGHRDMKMWAWFWSLAMGLLAIVELVSKVQSGRTISQQFWAYGVEHLNEAWMLTGAILAFAVVVGWHLMYGVYKRRKRK